MNTINMSKNPCITQNRPDIHIHAFSRVTAHMTQLQLLYTIKKKANTKKLPFPNHSVEDDYIQTRL